MTTSDSRSTLRAATPGESNTTLLSGKETG